MNPKDPNWNQIREEAIKRGSVNIREIDGVITIEDPNNPINPELREWLGRRGIDPDFYIEEEAKQWILESLKDPYFERAYIDKDNGLVIEFSDSAPDDYQIPVPWDNPKE